MDLEQRPNHTAPQSEAAHSGSSGAATLHITKRTPAYYGKALIATLSALAILITCAAVYIPFTPLLPAPGLDNGWRLGLTVAVAKHLIFGKDLIFTFGPYSPLYTRQYYPATDAMMLWGSTLIAVASGCILLCLSKGYARLIALAFALFLLLALSDAQFFALPLLALILVYRVSLGRNANAPATASLLLTITWLIAVPALGLLPLVKGTFGICADISVFFACILLIRRRRFGLALVTAAFFFASMALFWILAGQPIQDLPNYFLAQIPVITGYSDAMSVTGALHEVAVFVIAGLILWVLSNYRAARRSDGGLALAIGSALILFLGFKEGFVRADHAPIGGGILGMAAIALLLARQDLLSGLGCAVGLIGFMMINHIAPRPASFVDPIIAQFQDTAAAIASRIENPVLLPEEYTAALGTIRAAQPLPPISGTVDIYSYGQSLLLANGFDWDPRPVLQGYSAYTPQLQDENAAHLTGPQAPANILFTIEPIDNRVPALDDGPSWPSLLSAYQLAGLYGNYALLQRQAHPAAAPITPIISGTYQTGAAVSLPVNTPFVWAAITIRPTLLGKLLGLVFKLPQLRLTYIFPDGHQEEFRYIAGMGQSGFLLAPLVQTISDFGALSLPDARGYFAGREPSAIRLTAASGGGLFWHSRFSMKLGSIAFPVQPKAEQILLNPMRPAKTSLVPYPTTTSCSIDEINGNPATDRPIQVHDFLDISGWAAIDPEHGLAADQVTIALINPDGTETDALATLRPRPDVAAYFKHPALANSGFRLRTKLTDQPGIYTLTINPSHSGKTWSCSTRIPLQVMGSGTSGSDGTVH